MIKNKKKTSYDNDSQDSNNTDSDDEYFSDSENYYTDSEDDSDSETKYIDIYHKGNKTIISQEMIKNQLPNIPIEWKLSVNDIKRICKYIDTSIFDKKKCCIWKGYITNKNNTNKGTYINFYFHNKKIALHRLLYSNFVSTLDSSEYLKFNCENKGICCNINHYEKYKYSKKNNYVKKYNNGINKKDKIIKIIKSDNNLMLDFE